MYRLNGRMACYVIYMNCISVFYVQMVRFLVLTLILHKVKSISQKRDSQIMLTNICER